jgi:hypothetical protein
MQAHHARLALTLLIGVSLGAATGYITKFSPRTAAPVTEAIPTFDDAQFAKAEDIDSRLILARQLPSADAAMCASLAKAMLTKKISVRYSTDPFGPPNEEIRNAPLPEVVWEGLFKRWMQVAPQAAWDFVVAHHSEELPLREAALRQWARINTLAAAKAAGDEITDDEKIVILESSVEHDPESGLALVLVWKAALIKEERNPFTIVNGIVANLLTALAKKSPATAMEWCHAHSPELLASVCIGWNKINPSAFLDWLNSRPTGEQQNIMIKLCDQEDVTASTLRHFAKLGKAEEVKEIISSGLLHIAKRDENLSQELIDELLPNPTDRMVVRAEICDELRGIDPRKAMDYILPSLRSPMPLFENPDNSLGAYIGGRHCSIPNLWPFAEAFGDFIKLGPAAGIGKNEVLHLLGQFHPQYLSWMLNNNSDALSNLLGPPARWLQPFITQATREDIANLVSEYAYENAQDALQDAQSLEPGMLQDAVIEQAIETLLDWNTPVAEVLNQLSKIKGNHAELDQVYASWMVSDPVAALRHFAEDSNQTESEWARIIDKGYKQHAEEIQAMAEKLPPGELRDSVASDLSLESRRENADYITAFYWATEIAAKDDRTSFIKFLLEELECDRAAVKNAEIIAGIRSNIENSSLSDAEKARWLEHINTEVAP